MAQENNCFFLNITADLLRHKEYGRTEKVVAAIFSIAGKISQLQKHNPKRPTVIFMDEVDNILGGKETAHEAYLAARSIFAQKWDGIQKIPGMIVMGTTNYPDHLPGFIYRRFQSRTKVRTCLHLAACAHHGEDVHGCWSQRPYLAQIPLPTEASRKEILRKFVEYAGCELALLRDGRSLDSKDGVEDYLGNYLDASLLEDSVVERAPHSQEVMAPIVYQLKQVLGYTARAVYIQVDIPHLFELDSTISGDLKKPCDAGSAQH